MSNKATIKIDLVTMGPQPQHLRHSFRLSTLFLKQKSIKGPMTRRMIMIASLMTCCIKAKLSSLMEKISAASSLDSVSLSQLSFHGIVFLNHTFCMLLSRETIDAPMPSILPQLKSSYVDIKTAFSSVMLCC